MPDFMCILSFQVYGLAFLIIIVYAAAWNSSVLLCKSHCSVINDHDLFLITVLFLIIVLPKLLSFFFIYIL